VSIRFSIWRTEVPAIRRSCTRSTGCPTSGVYLLIDDDLASMLMRTWKKSGQARDMDEGFKRWAEEVAVLGRKKQRAHAEGSSGRAQGVPDA
jgi:hypothetical protein